jgi:ribonuclease-3
MKPLLDPKERRRQSRQLGYGFKNPELLQRAFTHKSFSNEAPEGDVPHNETLEFLGDAVLSLLVSLELMARRPEDPEGELSRRRAASVNQQQLAQAGRKLALGGCLRLGHGEELSGGREKDSLLADCFEAVVGAAFLDGGMRAAQRVVAKGLGEYAQRNPSGLEDFDPKSRLQEVLQEIGRSPPVYQVVSESGPDHQRAFTIVVRSGSRELGRGVGANKKTAEQSAARVALGAISANGTAGKD